MNLLRSILKRGGATFLPTALVALVLFTGGFVALPVAAKYVSPGRQEAGAAPEDAAPARTESAAAMRARVEESFGKLPLQFEANRGQVDERVKFLARGKGYNLFLTPTEAVLALRKNQPDKSSLRTGGRRETLTARESAVLRMSLRGANSSPAVEEADALAGKSNYFVSTDKSRWRANVETFARVKYAGVYPGVDMVYYGNQGQLEYDFLVAPRADARAIRLAFDGADRMEIDARPSSAGATGVRSSGMLPVTSTSRV